jgi:transcriptional regulator with XRE-family HTH domain
MKTAPAILPKNLKILKDLGEHIQLARLRRKLSADQIAERTGLGRKTIYNIEQGSPTVAIGKIARCRNHHQKTSTQTIQKIMKFLTGVSLPRNLESAIAR